MAASEQEIALEKPQKSPEVPYRDKQLLPDRELEQSEKQGSREQRDGVLQFQKELPPEHTLPHPIPCTSTTFSSVKLPVQCTSLGQGGPPPCTQAVESNGCHSTAIASEVEQREMAAAHREMAAQREDDLLHVVKFFSENIGHQQAQLDEYKEQEESVSLGLQEIREVLADQIIALRKSRSNEQIERDKLTTELIEVRAKVEGYCQCMEEQKKTLALANENITLLKSQLQSHEEIRRHDQIERDKSEVIIKDLGRRCEALQSELDGLTSEKENILAQYTTHQEEKRELEEGKRGLEEGKMEVEKQKRELEECKRELEEARRGLEEDMKGLEQEKRRLEEGKRGLEEEKRRLEEERRLLQQNQDHHHELQKASEDHTSHVNEQLKLYQSDFEKERAERERLLMNYDVLERRLSEASTEKMLLHQEKTALEARHLELETVHGGAQTKIKMLEEEKSELEEKRRNLVQQLQKASEDHTSHVNEQLKLYQSDFAKERAEREKLLMKHDTLEEMLSATNTEKVSLQKEITILTARHRELETVHGGAQTKIKTLEEEKRGLEEERRNLVQQLQKASEDHSSHVNEQLKLYQSDFEKERAEREKLLMKHDTLEEMLSKANTEKVSLQKEMTALTARHQELESVHGGAQAKINTLEEEKRGLEEERKLFHVHVDEQLKLYQSDFAKERAEREKLLMKHDTLEEMLSKANTEKVSLQKDITVLRAKLQEYENGSRSDPSTPHSSASDKTFQHPLLPLKQTVRSQSDDPHLHSPSQAMSPPYHGAQATSPPYHGAQAMSPPYNGAQAMSPPHHAPPPKQTVRSQSDDPHLHTPSQAMSPPYHHSLPQQTPPPQPFQAMPPSTTCPICGRSGFRTLSELQLHSAKCGL